MDTATQGPESTRLPELRASARGWHGVQLAVLGFIGLCGVLQGDAGADLPRWLQVWSGVLVLVSLALACVATALVALVAWPVYGAASRRAGSPDEQAEIEVSGQRLRRGIVLTFIAVVLLALAATSSWWPTGGGSGSAALTEVTTEAGTVCGELGESQQGAVALDVDGREVAIALSDVVSLRPVDGCG